VTLTVPVATIEVEDRFSSAPLVPTVPWKPPPFLARRAAGLQHAEEGRRARRRGVGVAVMVPAVATPVEVFAAPNAVVAMLSVASSVLPDSAVSAVAGTVPL
jgi:hypothetical protein